MIDPEIHKSLRERFSPEGSQLRAVQMRMLEMLESFDAYARRHGIKYWLSSGTCIGAMRHSGFIPWDDDVDIELEYAQWRKLRKALKKEPLPGMALHYFDNDEQYMLTFPKLRDLHSHIDEAALGEKQLRAFTGLYIDIFVMVPSNSLKLFHLSSKFYHLLVCRPFNMPYSKLRSLLMHTVRPLYYNVVSPLLRQFMKIGAGTRRRHMPGTAYDARRDARHFKQLKRVPFEGLKLPVPEKAGDYLELIFGNWQKLPSPEQITPHLTEAKIFPRK